MVNLLNPGKVLIAASEAVPFVKTGGLGDVCGALPKALNRIGYDARLVLPRYWAIDREKYKLKNILSPMGVRIGPGVIWCEVLEGEINGVKVYFIDHENYFGRAGLYDDGKWEYYDNAERFAFFSKACIQLCRDTGFRPDIIHCNDWQTALIPPYLKIHEMEDLFFKDTATVFSIHNIGYQGTFSREPYDFLDLGDDNFTESKFENYGGINFMKGAIFYADAINTVSPTYAKEILSDIGGNGIAPYLERRKDDLYGILNGADYDHWDPAVDPFIPANYTVLDIAGKSVCKSELQKEFGLETDPDIPVIGVVSRFADQKGFHLVRPVVERIINDMSVQFVFLGSGEKELEDFFGHLPARYPGKIGAWIGYNNEMAHRIEAGSDFFLMPSLYEPCGLNQIYSLKYGTLPIVREIGGLKDTVKQYDEKDGSGTGFCFKSADPWAVYYTIGWAVSTYYDRPFHIRKMIDRGMREHFSWEDSAVEYDKLYAKAIERRKTWL